MRDPDAKLYRKGASMEAKLALPGHASMENGSGLSRQRLPHARRWPRRMSCR
jgi:hypothetical protein